MSLHLVRLPVDPRALARFAVEKGASDDDGGYALHLALIERFGSARPQPFRPMEGSGGDAFLLGYTADPDALRDAAALPPADPQLDRVLGGAPELRAMPAEWREGQRLGFEVRVRPVVRFGKRIKAERAASDAAKTPDGWYAKAGEVDAWIAARTRPGGDPDTTRDDAYAAWLADRLAGVAELEKAELRRFRRVDARRSSHGRPGARRVEGPDAVMAGTLTVSDPAAFARTLARGIGRHAAFGYGMLLLSPPGRGA